MKWYYVEQSSIIAQNFNKYEGREEWNQHIVLYEKWWALLESWAEILPVTEGTKWTCVGD